ncbi:MAG: hypothetical protein RLZZ519_1752 [Bacteroidota bacterium]|jgi:hypothetical protein
MQDAKWHKFFLGLALLLIGTAAFGQAVVPTLTVPQKQVQIGRPFEVELGVTHPEKTVVVFPDSTKDFKPYEVKSGKSKPTRTQDGISEDVKIYQIYTWEIDSLQKLQFPVRFLTEKGDTQTVMSNEVLIEFMPVIPAYNDTLPVRVISDLGEIREPINWMAWGIIFAVGLILILVGVLVFSSPIKKWLKRRRIELEFKRHLAQLEAIGAAASDQPVFFPRLNRVWRSYFDRDWYLALGAMTTTELRDALPKIQVLDDEDRRLLDRLSNSTDLVLYAGVQQDEVEMQQLLEAVRRIMQKEYARRKEAAEV